MNGDDAMTVCVFDTETTGLIENHSLKLDKQPEVIEFACAIVDWDLLLNVREAFETFIRPYNLLPERTKTTTGLSDEDLVKAPRFKEVAEAIKSYIEGSDVVVGHNLSYDIEMMDLEFERLGQKIAWPSTKVCTIEQTIHITGNRIKLGDLYKMFTGVEHKDAHRAMPDVLATLTCLKGIREKGWL